MSRLIAALLTGCILGSAGPVRATEIQPLPLDQLAGKSGVIVLGDVTGVKRLDGEKDEVTVRVATVLKGDSVPKSFTVVLVCRSVPGGIPNDYDPEVKAGDRGVFFLKQISGGQGELAFRGSLSVFPKGAVFSVAADRLKPPVVQFTGTTVKYGHTFLAFEVTNPNEAPVPYSGYTPDSFTGGLKEGTIAPLYRVELRNGPTWADHAVGHCGTGRGPVEIPPRSKVTFDVLAPGGAWDAVKVGLVWWDPSAGAREGATAWSGAISRKDAEGTAPPGGK
jgi:hypothetical protein